MTSWEVPLPPDDLATVWDKDADPWMRLPDSRGFPGGMWQEARTGLGAPSRRKWAELVAQFGPVTDYEPRCEFGVLLQDLGRFRCLLATNHTGHHKLPEDCWTEPER